MDAGKSRESLEAKKENGMNGLSPHLLQLAAKMLDEYADRLGNAICNDMELEGTPENIQMCKDINDVRDFDLNTDAMVIGKKIITYDWLIASYLAKKLQAAAGTSNE